MPESLVIEDELTLRKERLGNLAQAEAVLEARAKHRKRPRGREPKPPEAGPRDKDQYNLVVVI